MGFINARRIRLLPLLLAALALAACGFHLRQSATLPAAMQHVHLDARGGSNFQRQLSLALERAGVTVEDAGGPGIAEFSVPTAAFSTDTLTSGGYARISEYAVHYTVKFSVADASGQILVPSQTINMSREFSYDASNTVGSASQVEQIEKSLDDDMVQAIMFRLEAAGHRPAAASSVH